MKMRKPILLVDDSPVCQKIKDMFKENEIEYVEYHIKKFGESCCGEIPTTKAPSVIAAEGIFKGKDSVNDYIEYRKEMKGKQGKEEVDSLEKSQSAFW
jgi:hypothetical protein